MSPNAPLARAAHWPGRALLLAAGIMLAACTPPDTVADEDLESYYALTTGLIARAGGMRTETAPADARVTAQDLVRNFQVIALRSEYTREGDTFVEGGQPIPLARWTTPIRYEFIFGPSVSPDQRAQDEASTRRYLARISRLTGVPMRPAASSAEANFTLAFLNRAEQRAFAQVIRQQSETQNSAFLNGLEFSTPQEFCSGYIFGSSADVVDIRSAFVLIKHEQKGLAREACIHEEIAQSMGLVNDSLEARPSIFNDDYEFALLTRHDEVLLAMLYDPALRPGMTATEVVPLLPGVATRALRRTGSNALVTN
ncbi:MAG: DUF2927 domain-containing protein [Pseudomonadota bacterium]